MTKPNERNAANHSRKFIKTSWFGVHTRRPQNEFGSVAMKGSSELGFELNRETLVLLIHLRSKFSIAKGRSTH